MKKFATLLPKSLSSRDTQPFALACETVDGKGVELFLMALFVKIVVFKTKLFKVDWSGSARLLRKQRDR
ncbi:hypothetical protein QNH26_18565 [Peribacillus frigoritolerans]|uniref:hypothetical protein n=1 Tax=Peribacillus frigoritolerans TaxID=450367 RepID=UPI0024C10A8E|nr:hypothetical protein [Peribacillus frigoritolerans]WHX65682.1 hypothetical protein QNH26_18565 [Peribacillus frigoritolerans]